MFYRDRLKNKSMPYLTKKALRKKIIDLCKKVSVCSACGETNGVVKKCGLLKISHEKYRNCKKNNEMLLDKLAEFEHATQNNKEMEGMISSGICDLRFGLPPTLKIELKAILII